MRWNALTVTVAQVAEEAVSALLIELGAAGVEIENSNDLQQYETRFGEVLPLLADSEMMSVRAYFPENVALSELTAALQVELSQLTEFFEIPDAEITTSTLVEEDWANGWKKYYQVTRISRDLTIVPSWSDYAPVAADEKLIRLDPGMAFGTGTHPTTKLSLFALEETLRGGETMIDVGTGSGVLSIAASLLGAESILATDIDDVAVKVAEENIALNTDAINANKISVIANDLLKNLLGKLTEKVDIIVANILADILLDLIDDAYALTKDGGALILSGITSAKFELVNEKALSAGFKLETRMTQGYWNAAIYRKQEDEFTFG